MIARVKKAKICFSLRSSEFYQILTATYRRV